MKTATQIMLANLDLDMTVALERANRSNKMGDILRVNAIRSEMTELLCSLDVDDTVRALRS